MNNKERNSYFPNNQSIKVKNRPAFTGFILGVASVLFFEFWLIPFLAIVFSAIGLQRTGSIGGKGKVAAWVGLILGILYLLDYVYTFGG